MRALLLLIPIWLLASDTEEITRVLNQWPKDFNAKNLEATCGLFAPNSIAVYPDSNDRDYEGICNTFKAIFKDPALTFTYDAPNIKEIIVDKDMAAVRLIWVLRVLKDNKQIQSVTEIGLDVFQKQPDGSWKIRISSAYPG